MRKIFLIIILIVINVLAFSYLKESIYARRSYELNLNHNVFVIPKREIIIDDPDDFRVNDYFYIYTFNDYDYRYYFDSDHFYLQINNLNLVYPYKIREKEVEIIETVVVKEVYVREENKTPEPAKPAQDDTPEIDYDYEKDYFELDRDHFNYIRGSSISSIIADIQSHIHTNVQVTMDYSSLNPNDPGEYPLYLITSAGSYTVYVQID